MMRSVRAIKLTSIGVLVVMAGSVGYARPWTDTTGKYRIEADFVELKDGNVVLKKVGGDTVQVPLDRLSDEDREFAQTAAKKSVAGGASVGKSKGVFAPPESDLAKLEASAQSQRNALAAAKVFQAYLDANPDSPETARIKERMQHWEQLALKKAVRLGTTHWYPREEAESQEKSLDESLKEAARMIEVGNEEVVRIKLEEASKATPWSVDADWRLGLLCAVVFRDADGAQEAFETCLKKRASSSANFSPVDRANVAAAHNNLAIIRVRQKKWREALASWRNAVEYGAASPEVAHNLGKFSRLAKAHAELRVPNEITNSAAQLYAKVAVISNSQRLQNQRGWLYMRFLPELKVADLLTIDKPAQPRAEAPTTAIAAEKPVAIVVPPPPPEIRRDMVLIGGGSGFIIAPELVMTNRHVVADGHGFVVIDPATKTEHEAQVKVISQDEDLALVSAPGLSGPAASFASTPPRLATEVVILGFPAFFDLGQDLKISRGAIAGLPNPKLENKLLYDAVTNPGNSGGPVCDQHGSIVAVHTAGLGAAFLKSLNAGKLGAGVPAAQALDFATLHVPGIQRAPMPMGEPRPWVDVVETIGKSTTNVLVYRRANSIDFVRRMAQKPVGDGDDTRTGSGRNSANSRNVVSEANVLEDRWCLLCFGSGKQPCPQRGCNRGKIRAQMTEVVGGTAAGRVLSRQRTIYDVCPTCRGQDKLPCKGCRGGFDIDY